MILSGRAVITIKNDNGVTERLNEGSVLGEVTDVLKVVPSFQSDSDVGSVVGQVRSDNNCDLLSENLPFSQNSDLP